MALSLIDDAEFIAQLDALDRDEPAAGDRDHSGDNRRDHREPSTNHQESQERSRPFWEEKMREGAAAFAEAEGPAPAPAPTGMSRVTAVLGLMLCTAAGAGAAALVFHDRLALLLR